MAASRRCGELAGGTVRARAAPGLRAHRRGHAGTGAARAGKAAQGPGSSAAGREGRGGTAARAPGRAPGGGGRAERGGLGSHAGEGTPRRRAAGGLPWLGRAQAGEGARTGGEAGEPRVPGGRDRAGEKEGGEERGKEEGEGAGAYHGRAGRRRRAIWGGQWSGGE
eukprot:XP_023156390.1 spidroin-1-like [Zea mays]